MSDTPDAELVLAIKIMEDTRREVAHVCGLDHKEIGYRPSPQSVLNQLRIIEQKLGQHILSLEVFEKHRITAASMTPPKALFVYPDGKLKFEDAHYARNSGTLTEPMVTDGAETPANTTK